MATRKKLDRHTSTSKSKSKSRMEKKPASPRRVEKERSRGSGARRRRELVLDRSDPELGVVAIIEALEGVQFPATKDEIVEAVGDRTIRLQRGATSMKLGDLIGDLECEKFESLGGVVGPVAGNLRQQVFGRHDAVAEARNRSRAVAGS
jgi:hypothetical protein